MVYYIPVLGAKNGGGWLLVNKVGLVFELEIIGCAFG